MDAVNHIAMESKGAMDNLAMDNIAMKKSDIENMTMDNLAKHNIAMDNIGMNNIGMDNIGMDNIAMDNIAMENRAIDNIAMDNMATDNIAMDQMARYNIAKDNIAMDNIAKDNIAMDNIATDNMAMDNVAMDNIAMDNIAMDNIAMDNIAVENIAMENVGMDNIAMDIVRSPVLESQSVTYASYNFEGNSLELARSQWPNYGDQHYLRGCKWSPDGTCLLTVVRGAGMHVMELPADLYTNDVVMMSRPVQPLVPAVSVPESGLIYDYCWYPGMNSQTPATCCWLASGHEGPIHLWDAFTGELRCSYRGFNQVDELEAAISVTFSADGQSVFCGYKKNIKIFRTSRPGKECEVFPVSHPASCITASLAQPGVVAIGTWKNTIELVAQSDGSFRQLWKLTGHKGGITSMAFSLDGMRLYSGARKDKEIICWDLRVPGRPLFCLNREANTNQKISIDISQDGKWLISGGTDGKVQVWDVAENLHPTKNVVLPLHNDCCNGVSLHPYRPVLATASGQHHAQDPLHHTRITPSHENALVMWWVGQQQEDPDILTTIIKAATNS